MTYSRHPNGWRTFILAKAKDSQIRLTVFTPTYNRLDTLERTFESLRAQTCKDFRWLIIDDGSTDDTKQAAAAWQQSDPGFEIRYIYKKNGGMHTAHNEAYRHIDTELNVCIDSDDLMPPDAVREILEKWDSVRGRKDIAGIIAKDADLQGRVIGRGFPKGMRETTLCAYYAGGGTGDKKLIYRTDIINSCPEYPVFEGEKYVALGYKYRMIDQNYKMAVLDRIVCLVDYRPDGSTNTMLRQYLRNPRGFAFWRKFCLQYPTNDSARRQFMNCVHYVSSSLLAGNPHFIKESPRKAMTAAAVPFGIALTVYIKIKAGSR